MTAAPATFENLGHTTPGQDLAALSSLVKSLPGDCVCIEVGVYAGSSTKAMLEAGAKTVYAIDHWGGNRLDSLGALGRVEAKRVFDAFARNMGDDFLRRAIPLFGHSHEWAQRWPWPVDLVYLDATHTYEAVKEDVWRWGKHVKPGGILAGHDYGVFDGVEQAVHELLENVQVNGRVWWARM